MLTKAEITLIKSLGDKKSRSEHGLFVVEGRKIVSELRGSGFETERIFTTEQNTNYEHISPKEMSRISALKTPSDYLAVVKTPSYALDMAMLNNSLILALDDIQDPGNLGTIIRLADWFGIRDILCSKLTADCFNPKVIQASMGAILRVRLHYVDLVDTLSRMNSPIYGTFLSGENIYEKELTSQGVIVMGNEGKGISSAVESMVSSRLYIPSFGGCSESLNVAVASAVVCSEFKRRG